MASSMTLPYSYYRYPIHLDWQHLATDRDFSDIFETVQRLQLYLQAFAQLWSILNGKGLLY